MKFSFPEKILVALMIVLAVIAGGSFCLSSIGNFFTSKTEAVSVSPVIVGKENLIPIYIPPQKLSNPPEIIKGVYVTGYSAGSKKYLDYLSNLFKNTEINAVVVNIKGSDGGVTYPKIIKDIDELVRFFHDQNVYVIGRIAVFQDPVYSKIRPEISVYNKTDLSLWRDNNGLSWLDPASKDAWDYNISLAKDAFLHGFDEINFDYVRFPTDGNKDNMGFPVWDGLIKKSDVIQEFFIYTRQELTGQKISVDLFGQTTTNKDDMGIGQVIENAFENFDYISPMVYPSHYINGFIGFENPASHPYEIVKYSMDGAIARLPLTKFRPWLQDFNMGADYTADMVKAEIKATQDALGSDYNGYMLWNPSNVYTQEAVWKTL